MVQVIVEKSSRERFVALWGQTLERHYGEEGAERISYTFAAGAPLADAEAAEIDGAEGPAWSELAAAYRLTTGEVRTLAAKLIVAEARQSCSLDWLEELDDAIEHHGIEKGLSRWLELWLIHLLRGAQ